MTIYTAAESYRELKVSNIEISKYKNRRSKFNRKNISIYWDEKLQTKLLGLKSKHVFLVKTVI